ncbi:arylesterase [Alteromonadaceae bacterium M269]|nr:arylesterase [Alteromonadaceae bacterium M269]
MFFVSIIFAGVEFIVVLRLKLVLMLIPFLLISDQLWAKEVKLMILGDSLSAAYGLKQEQGWVSLLQNAWDGENITIINAAVSGETTDGGLARLPRLLKQHQPTHMLIELGGNDGLRGYPINKMKANLKQMVEAAQSENVDVIIQQMQIPTNFGRRYTELFTNTFTDIAEEYQIPVIPFLLEEIALNDDLMQQDQIHPNAKAQPMITAFMDKQLRPLLNINE